MVSLAETVSLISTPEALFLGFFSADQNLIVLRA